jgi:hypothetical protein
MRFAEANLPERWFKRVVFPAPDAPIILTNSPGLAHPETPLRIGFGSSVDFFPHLPGGGAAEIVMSCQLSYILV